MNSVYKALVLKLVKILYEEVIYPMASDHVKKSPEKWDDTVLEFINELYKNVIKKLS